MMKEYIFMALMLLQAADIYTTTRIIGTGGREINPAMAWLMRELGVMPALVVSKCLMLIVVLALLPQLPMWFMTGLCVFYAFVVWHNWRQDTGRA